MTIESLCLNDNATCTSKTKSTSKTKNAYQQQTIVETINLKNEKVKSMLVDTSIKVNDKNDNFFKYNESRDKNKKRQRRFF